MYVWGRNYLDVNSGKKQTTFAPTEEQRKYGLQCEYVAQNLIDLLPSSWIDDILTSQFVSHVIIDMSRGSYCFIVGFRPGYLVHSFYFLSVDLLPITQSYRLFILSDQDINWSVMIIYTVYKNVLKTYFS